MDTQTVQAMHNAAAGNNGTTTPSHLLPTEVTAQAAKRAAASLLTPTDQPSAAPVDVQRMLESEQHQQNRTQMAERLKAKLNPGAPVQAQEPVTPFQPQTVADVTQSSQPVLINEPLIKTEADLPSQPEVDVEDTITTEVEANPKAEDFKKVRAALKQHKTTAKDLLEQKTKLETRVQELEPQVSEELPRLRQRVQELEPLASLVSLKTSDSYKEKFIEPIKSLEDKLKLSAKDYGVPEKLIEQASTITNRKELNHFILQHFDEVEGLEVKNNITQLQKIRGELASAEAEPSSALERLTQEHLQLKDQREGQRRNQITETGKSAWASALLGIRQEGKYHEVIPRENDPEFNQTWVEPITKKAAEDYGRAVSHLGQEGLSKLDPQFGKSLASTILRATLTDIAVARANAAEAELREVRANLDRYNGMLRPGVGTTRGGGNSAPQASRPDSPKATAKALLNHVGVKY